VHCEKVHVNFDVLGKVHVNFADDISMKAEMAITDVSVQISWLIFSSNVHSLVYFSRVVFRIKCSSQM
jgi:hypothetical protein